MKLPGWYEICETCANMDTNQHGFHCMLVHPLIDDEDETCLDYEEDKRVSEIRTTD